MRDVITTEHAPVPVGPYSQAIRTEQFVFTAGQVGLDPVSGRLVDGGVEAQARQALENLQAVIEKSGCELVHVVKTTVFLTTMEHFKPVNAVYAEYFGAAPPARSAVAVSELPLGGLVEIEAILCRK